MRRAWGWHAASRNGVVRRTAVRADVDRFIVTPSLTVGAGSPTGALRAPEPGLPHRPAIFGKPAPRGDRRVPGRGIERATFDRVHELAGRAHGLGGHPLPGIADQDQSAATRTPRRQRTDRLQ